MYDNFHHDRIENGKIDNFLIDIEIVELLVVKGMDAVPPKIVPSHLKKQYFGQFRVFLGPYKLGTSLALGYGSRVRVIGPRFHAM